MIKGPNTTNFIADAVKIDDKIIKDNNQLKIIVSIKNIGAGHYFPTGSPFRNVILLVEAKDLDGKKLKYKGENILPIYAGSGTDTSDYAGLPGKIFAKIIESNPLSNYCERIPNKQGIIEPYIFISG